MDATLERIPGLMKEKRMTAYAMEDVLGVPHGSFSNWCTETIVLNNRRHDKAIRTSESNNV